MAKINKSLIGLLLLIVVTLGALPQQPTVKATSPTDDWSMFGHDAARTSYSNSSVPASAATPVWISEDIFNLACAPVIRDGKLYIVNGDYLFCFNASNGTEIWQSKLANPNDYIGVAVDGMYVYTTSAAYNTSTGSLMFIYAKQGATSPIVVDGAVFLGSHTEVFAVNASSGSLLWVNDDLWTENSPAFADGLLFLSVYGTSNDGIYALNAYTGKQVWYYRLDSSLGRLAVADGRVYVNAQYTVCLDAFNGTELWRTMAGGFVGKGSPVIVGQYLVLGTTAVDSSTGILLWNNTDSEFSGEIYSPVAADNTVYLYGNVDNGQEGMYSIDEKLFALDISTGNIIWEYIIPNSHDTWIQSYPVVADGMVYVVTRSGLYAFGNPSTPADSAVVPWFLVPLVFILAVAVAVLAAKILRDKRKQCPKNSVNK